jgi:hypothetical protein
MSNTTYCSFCGRSSDEAGKLMESSGRADPHNMIRICLDCARMAVGLLERLEAEQKPNNETRTP